MSRFSSCKALPSHPRTVGLIAALITLMATVYLMLLRSPIRVYETTDILGYWSPAHLLAQRKNPYDPQALLALQREQGWPDPEPVYSWNPPWLYLALLPLGALPFREAAALWFLINPLLIGGSALLMWEAVSKRKGLRGASLALLATFLFSRTLHTLLMGQISTLVLICCAGFLALTARRRDLLAGLLLILATAKPLAYLLLPTLLLVSLLEKRWRVIISFSGCLMLLILLVISLLPSSVEAYLSLFEFPASPKNYPVDRPPTIRAFLLARTGFDVGILPAVVCLAAFLSLISIRGRHFDLPTTASLSLIVGLPTAPFGWSFDQILLLLPIFQIIAWIPSMRLAEKGMVMLSLTLIYSYALLVWLVTYREVAFLVVAPMVGLVWWYARRKALDRSRMMGEVADVSSDAAPRISR